MGVDEKKNPRAASVIAALFHIKAPNAREPECSLAARIEFRFSILQKLTRVRRTLASVSRQRAYLPVPEIAIDTHRAVRPCRSQAILRITIILGCVGTLVHVGASVREHDYTP